MTETMVSVRDLVKQYDSFTAVDHLSFEVHAGEIFGLLGPNGAGKTTTIRVIMDIIKPDEGQVAVLGREPAAARALVGYLPEERGLYRDLRLVEVLVYLAALKGVPRRDARDRALHWLERVDLADRASSRVRDLSRGMQQKLQFIASLIHDPGLLILDEPFAGLDPVNVGLMKDLIRELQGEGKTIVLSAHQMNLVEELCNRIALINRGRAVLYGDLARIKQEYAPSEVRLRTPDDLPTIPGVAHIEAQNGQILLTLEDTLSAQDLLQQLVARGIRIESFEVASAPLEEIFIAVVKGAQHA